MSFFSFKLLFFYSRKRMKQPMPLTHVKGTSWLGGTMSPSTGEHVHYINRFVLNGHMTSSHLTSLSATAKMAAHLSYGRVNLNILREAARKELREFLDKCAGSKVRCLCFGIPLQLNKPWSWHSTRTVSKPGEVWLAS